MASILGWWFGLLGLGLVVCAAVLLVTLVLTLPRALPPRFRVGALVTALKCGAWGSVLVAGAVFIFGWGLL
jgi:hypothetical protein